METIQSRAFLQHCVFCSKPFFYIHTDIKKHFEVRHSQGTDQHCDVCSKPNPYRADMKIHSNNIHY